MTEAIIIGAAILIGGLSITIGLNARNEWAERDRLRRFQEAMRAGGRDVPLPRKRED